MTSTLQDKSAQSSEGPGFASFQATPTPVFVMNLYYTGIGIARNLRGCGVKVYGLTSSKDAPGVTSRFFDGIYAVPDGRDEPEALCKQLLEIRKSHTQDPIIFPTRDFDVLFLHEYREQLLPFYRLPQSKGQAIPRLLDKFELASIARRHQIPTPKTVVCSSPEELDKHVHMLQFPLVVKPRFAYQWRRKGAWEKVGAQKAILVDSVDQLRDIYLQLQFVQGEVLLQEYIAGADSDIVVCCCYINQNGELLGYFTAKKLRQNPPHFGTGCAVEAMHIPEIVAPSVQLLRACEYAGLAEIEFKYDRSANTFFLIEINPRHWDQHELGNLVGINLTQVALQDLLGDHPNPQVPTYRESIPCKWIAERELFLLLMRNAYLEIAKIQEADSAMSLRIIRKYCHVLKNTSKELRGLLRGQKVFSVFHPRDPLPGMFASFQVLREFSKICVTRIGQRFFAQQKHSQSDT
jgi:D-aspartate ligase